GDSEGAVLHDGRQPGRVVRLPSLGNGSEEEPDRRGVRDLLAAEPHLDLFRLRLVRAGRARHAPAARPDHAPASIEANRSPLALRPGPTGPFLCIGSSKTSNSANCAAIAPGSRRATPSAFTSR